MVPKAYRLTNAILPPVRNIILKHEGISFGLVALLILMMQLNQYLAENQIRLVIIKDPKSEALLTQQTTFEKIDQIEGYLFYYAVL